MAPGIALLAEPQFIKDYTEAMVREGADELTLRKQGEGALRIVVDITKMGDSGWDHRSWMRTGMQFVKPSTEASRGAEGEIFYHKNAELHKAVNLKKLASEKTKTLLANVAKTNEEASNDRSSESQIESRTSVRRALWEAHMKSPTAALEEALRRTKNGARRAQSCAARRSETNFFFIERVIYFAASCLQKTSGVYVSLERAHQRTKR